MRAVRPAPGERLALFAECVLVGVFTALLMVPLITLLPALAAGCAHISAHHAGASTTLSSYLSHLRRACRGGGLLLGAGLIAGLAVMVVDLAAARAGLPGAAAVAVVCVAFGAGLAVLALRLATEWAEAAAESPEVVIDWFPLVRRAARVAVVEDPRGSLLLLIAVGLLVVVTWQLFPLIIPMLGCVVMAAVAVRARLNEA